MVWQAVNQHWVHGQAALPVAYVLCDSAKKIFPIDTEIDCKLYGNGIVLKFLKMSSCIEVNAEYCRKMTFSHVAR